MMWRFHLYRPVDPPDCVSREEMVDADVPHKIPANDDIILTCLGIKYSTIPALDPLTVAEFWQPDVL